MTRLTRRSQAVALGRLPPAAPRWPALSVILFVSVGLFALTDVLTPEGAWRAITDCLMVTLMFGAVAGWVRVNRPALARIDERACEVSQLEIRYVPSERHPQWRPEAMGRRREHVRLRGVRRDSPGPEER